MDPYRLPRTVVPSRYDLRLEPDLTTLTFRGVETVAITISEPVREIYFNAIELAIDEAVVVDARGREQRATATLDETTERCRLDVAEPLAIGAGSPAADLPRDAQRQAPRLLPLGLQGPERRDAHDGRHPVRGHRRPPCIPLLGRAGVQGRLRRHARHRPRAHRGVQHAHRVRDDARAAARSSASPTPSRCPPTWWRSWSASWRPPSPVAVGPTPVRVWCVPGKRQLAAFGHEIAVALAAVLRGRTTGCPIRATSSTSWPSPTSRPAPWRTSAPSPSARPPCSSTSGAASHAELRARGRRGRARERPHVVRRPRHDDLVERHLAERGVRHVHGDAGGRRLEAASGSAGSPSACRARRALSPWTACTPRDPSSSRSRRRAKPTRCSTCSPTRRAPRSSACSSSIWGPRCSGTACASTSPSTASPTPTPATCGPPSAGPPASPSRRSWTAGSSRPAIRW